MTEPPNLITADLIRASVQRLRDRGVIGPLVLACISAHADRCRELIAELGLTRELSVRVDSRTAPDELALSGLKPKAKKSTHQRRTAGYFRQFERKRHR